MLASPTIPFHSSHPTAKSSLLSSSRPALADSTNLSTRSDARGTDPKSSVYPISSVRTSCNWNDIESSSGSISTSFHSRHIPLSPAPSPFLVTYKAPATVSISLSAVCSQSIQGEQLRSPGAQGLGSDLPVVKSVVPFPSTQLGGGMDVEMLDETCPCSDGRSQSSGHVPRKRRSAHSSISFSPGSLGKDANQKRPRKGKRQVVELWWLGVVHRSILRGIEACQLTEQRNSCDSSLSRPHDLGAMDRLLVERIERRLAGHGCVDGRLPSPLPRISPPSISLPSLNRSAPTRETLNSDPLTLVSDLKPRENSVLDRTVRTKTPPCALSIISYSPFTSSTPTSRRRHVHFEIAHRPRQPHSHPSVPRRSPSPPARTGTVPSNPQTLILTIPQLVASLTLANHGKSRSGLRGRICKPMEYGKNTGHPLPLVSRQVAQNNDGDVLQDKKRVQQSFILLRARLSNTPGRKSPLSHVAYVEG